MTGELKDVRLAQLDAADWSGAAGEDWNDAESVLRHLSEHTNIVRASELVSWETLLPEPASVLDLGCGSGWLTGQLSGLERVNRVIAWDASPALLRDVLPELIELVGGDAAKVERVCGQFTPLLLDDDSVDAVVMSSAFHHAENADELLADLTRVVQPRGPIVLLNEVPFSPLLMSWVAAATAFSAASSSVSARFGLRRSGRLGAEEFLYDEQLGDRTRTMAQWHRLFERHGLDVDVIATPYPSYPTSYRPRLRFERNLTHFVLRQSATR